jgi:uncharacterized protein YaiL (DUF2058 family)
MSNSLREKLLGLGFKAPEPEPPKPRAERPADGVRRDGRPPHAGKPGERRDGRPPQAGKPGERRDGRPPQAGKPGERRDGRPPHAGKPGERRDGRPPQAGKPGERRDGRPPQAGKPGERRDGRPPQAAKPPRTREDIDLAKAYAIRAQREKDERIEAERVRQEEARVRREAKAKLAELLKDKGLNDPAAEIARHFPYGGKIKRIHVTETQLKALNAGELGVVQLDGRYLLVSAEMLAVTESVFAPAVALKVDPDAAPGDDPYADPLYQVPDDLVW